jgi:tRNA threonylcarbamoyladenosine biosynthesis protein TsaB
MTAMIILAIDTASPVCAVCLYKAGTVLAQHSQTIGTGHAERLMPMIEEVMATARTEWADIGMIAVSIGPGSFTGVRTGLAAAKGFAQGLNIAATGISTLQAIAFEARQTMENAAKNQPLRVVIDAKRGQVHCQDFTMDGTPEGGPVLLTLEDAKAGCGARALAGNAAGLVNAEAFGILPRAATASIAIFAEMAALRGPGDDNSLTMMPLYLRDADAKPQTGFALQRQQTG